LCGGGGFFRGFTVDGLTRSYMVLEGLKDRRKLVPLNAWKHFEVEPWRVWVGKICEISNEFLGHLHPK
jgi:hypothetical protein